MSEFVKRNNGGSSLSGQFFHVRPEVIERVRQIAPGWAEKTNKHIASTVVNGVPKFDLARPKIDGTPSRAIFNIPGGQKVTLPILIFMDEKFPQLFLGDERKIKQA